MLEDMLLKIIKNWCQGARRTRNPCLSVSMLLTLELLTQKFREINKEIFEQEVQRKMNEPGFIETFPLEFKK